MLIIDTQPVVYYSQLDEDHFFAWAQEIPCIKSIDCGYLHIQESEVDEQAMRDLLAILERYRLSAKPLAALCTPENESWFKDKDKFWYQDVFGNF
ncbi:MAG TPA: hypothetical protein DCF62_07405 [Porticoccaceae bacterium]|nr:hypothetical protein [Porticoccaceae bacterium]HCO58974.1 hypothetical protein [Porticoccaceae bacterium]